MANLSTAFGTCYIKAKSKQDILDLLKLQKEANRDTFFSTDLKYPETVELNIEKIDKDYYELVVTVNGTGRWTFDYNMENFFNHMFNKNFTDEEEFINLQDQLRTKEFEIQFEVIDYEPGCAFISEGKYVVTWKNDESNYDVCEESTDDFNVYTCRSYGIYDEAWNTIYALQNFDEFKNNLIEFQKNSNTNEFDNMVNASDEHLKEQLENASNGVYFDFDEFIYEFLNEYQNC